MAESLAQKLTRQSRGAPSVYAPSVQFLILFPRFTPNAPKKAL